MNRISIVRVVLMLFAALLIQVPDADARRGGGSRSGGGGSVRHSGAKPSGGARAQPSGGKRQPRTRCRARKKLDPRPQCYAFTYFDAPAHLDPVAHFDPVARLHPGAR